MRRRFVLLCSGLTFFLLLSVSCRQETAVATQETIPEPTPTLPSALMSDEPVVQRFLSPDYGLQAFLWWHPLIDTWRSGELPRELTMIQDMGFRWVKLEFSWREIEGIEKGKYDWWRANRIVKAAERADLKLLVRLDRQPFWSQEPGSGLKANRPPADLQDFGDFCGTISARYKGRIAAYQVWNEPNLGREWGDTSPDPILYTQMLKVCFEAIKASDPDAIVVSAGLAPTGTKSNTVVPDTEYLQAMYDAGASAYFDVLGLHAPGYKAPPELSPEEAAANPAYGSGRWFAFRHVEDMRAIMVANGDGAKQVAILEMGWTLDQVNPNYSWFAVDEQTQADYLVSAYQYAAEHWQPWIGLMTTVYMADITWTAEENEQWWWSIVLPDGEPRRAYYALQDMEKLGITADIQD